MFAVDGFSTSAAAKLTGKAARLAANEDSTGKALDTPCTGVCRIDPLYGLCEGCRRTREEIAGWRALEPAERRRIMEELPFRPFRKANPGLI